MFVHSKVNKTPPPAPPPTYMDNKYLISIHELHVFVVCFFVVVVIVVFN